MPDFGSRGSLVSIPGAPHHQTARISITNIKHTKSLSSRKTRTGQTVGYYIAFAGVGLSMASLGPTLPGLAEHTQTQLSQISFLFTARWLGNIVGSLLGGQLFDRIGGHTVLAFALLAMAITMFLAPLISLLWVLTMMLLIMGVAEGMTDLGCNTLLIWIQREKVGATLNGMHFAWGIGAFFAPIIVAQAILISGDIVWAYWVLALLMLPALIWLLRLPSPAVREQPASHSHTRSNHLLLAFIMGFLFLYTGAEVSFGGWIYTYTLAVGLGGEASAAYVNSVFWAGMTLGTLLAIPLAVRYSPGPMLLGALIGCLVFVGMAFLLPGSTWALWLATLGAGLTMASVFPTTIAYADRRMTITGQLNSLLFVGASAGAMFLPWFIGQFFESVGPRFVLLAIGLNLILALAVLVATIWVAARGVKHPSPA